MTPEPLIANKQLKKTQFLSIFRNVFEFPKINRSQKWTIFFVGNDKSVGKQDSYIIASAKCTERKKFIIFDIFFLFSTYKFRIPKKCPFFRKSRIACRLEDFFFEKKKFDAS